jgi:hypothetical protein
MCNVVDCATTRIMLLMSTPQVDVSPPCIMLLMSTHYICQTPQVDVSPPCIMLLMSTSVIYWLTSSPLFFRHTQPDVVVLPARRCVGGHDRLFASCLAGCCGSGTVALATAGPCGEAEGSGCGCSGFHASRPHGPSRADPGLCCPAKGLPASSADDGGHRPGALDRSHRL